MVVAEAALVIPVLVVVAFVLAWGVSVTGTWLTLADATRQVARDVARGVSVDEAILAAESRAPEAVLTVDDLGSDVSVTAEQLVAPPVPLLSGWRLPLRQSVVIPREWGSGEWG